MRNKTKMCSKWSIEIFLAYTHNLWRVWIFAKTEDRDTRSTAESQQREDQQRRRAAAGECSPPSGRGRSTRTTSPAGCTSAPSAATSCSPGAGTEGTRIHLKCHFAAPPSMRTSHPGQHSPTPFIRTPSLRLKRRKELDTQTRIERVIVAEGMPAEDECWPARAWVDQLVHLNLQCRIRVPFYIIHWNFEVPISCT